MFKIFLVVITAVFFVQNAEATNQYLNNHNANRVNVSPDINNRVNVNPDMRNRVNVNPHIQSSGGDARQSQIQSQNQENSQGQDQGQSQNANNDGNNQTTNYNAPRQRQMVPSMANFVPMPTSPCMATLGGAGAGAGFGFSIAGSYINENCEIQESAKTMFMVGQPMAAFEIACTGKHAKNTTFCLDLELANAQQKRQLLSDVKASQVIQEDNTQVINKMRNVDERRTRDASSWGGLHNF